MSVRIRPLRASDYTDVVRLLQGSGLPARTKGRDRRSAFMAQLRSNRIGYLGAFDGQRLVGVVFGTHDTRKGWINRLAVHPDHRRSGIAKRLVRACEASLRSAGMEMFCAIIEPDNGASEALFRDLGYEIMPMIYARRKLRDEV